MPKFEFLKPRFNGARFAEHTLPLEVARDLAAYETLVVELAKYLYIQRHQERQRVPKGFATDFHLHLESIDGGSASPVLSLVAAGMLALGGTQNVYFDRARDLIAECIAAPEGQLPAAFPRELLAHFNQVGRSLCGDEKMELPLPGGQKAVLTPERRKRLVLAAEQFYEQEIELSGTIEEADWEKSTFRLRSSDGTRIVIPMPASFHAQARIYGGRHRHQVTVRAVGAYDSFDQLKNVVSVDSLEVQPDYLLAAKFDELYALNAGWYDSQGVPPDKERLDFIASKMIGHYPENLLLPAIVPTPEGNLLFEWNALGEPTVDIGLGDLRAEFHAFHPESGNVEREFNLEFEWSEFIAFLTQNIKPRSA